MQRAVSMENGGSRPPEVEHRSCRPPTRIPGRAQRPSPPAAAAPPGQAPTGPASTPHPARVLGAHGRRRPRRRPDPAEPARDPPATAADRQPRCPARVPARRRRRRASAAPRRRSPTAPVVAPTPPLAPHTATTRPSRRRSARALAPMAVSSSAAASSLGIVPLGRTTPAGAGRHRQAQDVWTVRIAAHQAPPRDAGESRPTVLAATTRGSPTTRKASHAARSPASARIASTSLPPAPMPGASSTARVNAGAAPGRPRSPGHGLGAAARSISSGARTTSRSELPPPSAATSTGHHRAPAPAASPPRPPIARRGRHDDHVARRTARVRPPRPAVVAYKIGTGAGQRPGGVSLPAASRRTATSRSPGRPAGWGCISATISGAPAGSATAVRRADRASQVDDPRRAPRSTVGTRDRGQVARTDDCARGDLAAGGPRSTHPRPVPPRAPHRPRLRRRRVLATTPAATSSRLIHSGAASQRTSSSAQREQAVPDHGQADTSHSAAPTPPAPATSAQPGRPSVWEPRRAPAPSGCPAPARGRHPGGRRRLPPAAPPRRPAARPPTRRRFSRSTPPGRCYRGPARARATSVGRPGQAANGRTPSGHRRAPMRNGVLEAARDEPRPQRSTRGATDPARHAALHLGAPGSRLRGRHIRPPAAAAGDFPPRSARRPRYLSARWTISSSDSGRSGGRVQDVDTGDAPRTRHQYDHSSGTIGQPLPHAGRRPHAAGDGDRDPSTRFLLRRGGLSSARRSAGSRLRTAPRPRPAAAA